MERDRRPAVPVVGVTERRQHPPAMIHREPQSALSALASMRVAFDHHSHDADMNIDAESASSHAGPDNTSFINASFVIPSTSITVKLSSILFVVTLILLCCVVFYFADCTHDSNESKSINDKDAPDTSSM